jgi:hypothetical protein
VSDWNSSLTAANYAAQRGFWVFPLSRSKRPAIPCPHPKGQRPPCRGQCGRFGHGVYDASPDAARVRELFDAAPWATAYGIACGRPPHHLIGIDLDVKDGRDGIADLHRLAQEHGFAFPRTATVSTPTGGLHLWLTAPPEAPISNSAREIADGIDIRGPAGYLVGPGSLTIHGHYAFAPGVPTTIAAAAPELLALLTAPPTAALPVPDPEQVRAGIRKQSAYGRAALDGECAKVHATRKPGRKTRLFASAAALARLINAGALDQDVTYDALLAAGLACDLTAAQCERSILRGFERGSTTVRVA